MKVSAIPRGKFICNNRFIYNGVKLLWWMSIVQSLLTIVYVVPTYLESLRATKHDPWLSKSYLSKPAVLSIWRSKGVRFEPPSSFWGRGTFGGGGALRGSPERSIARIAWELYQVWKIMARLGASNWKAGIHGTKNWSARTKRSDPVSGYLVESNWEKKDQTFPKSWLKFSSGWCQNFWLASHFLNFSIVDIILFDHSGIHTLSKVFIWLITFNYRYSSWTGQSHCNAVTQSRHTCFCYVTYITASHYRCLRQLLWQ